MCRVRLALCLIARDPVVEPALPLPGVLQNPLSVFDQGFAHALPRRWARDVPALTLFYQGFDELWGLNVEQIEDQKKTCSTMRHAVRVWRLARASSICCLSIAIGRNAGSGGGFHLVIPFANQSPRRGRKASLSGCIKNPPLISLNPVIENAVVSGFAFVC